MPGLAWWCEKHFEEWGYKSALLRRFHHQLTHGLVLHVLWHAALEADRREKDRRIAQDIRPGDVSVRGPLLPAPQQDIGTSAALVKACLAPKARGGGYAAQRRIDLEALRPAFVRPDTPEPDDREVNVDVGADAGMEAHPLVVEITRTREHVSTDHMLEYRVKVCPRQIISIMESGMRGLHPEPGPRRRHVKFAEDEPDDTDEEGGDEDEGEGNGKRKKKRGKKTDLNDDVLFWIPATIMRQVYPALVQDWEEGRRGGERGGGVNVNPAPRPRLAAGSQPRPAAPQAIPQVAPRAVDPVPILPPAVAPLPPPLGPPAPQRGGRGKGKGRARQRDEYDYLSLNPYAPAAVPQHDFNPLADTSLPFRVCGFIFSWPDPDDPDRLIVDTDERDDLPTMVNYREVENAGVFGEYGSPCSALRGTPRARARARALAATSSGRRFPAEAPSAHTLASASRSDDAVVGMSVDNNLAKTVAAASALGASSNKFQRNAARLRKRKGTDYHGSQIGDDDLGPLFEAEDEHESDGSNRYSLHASEIDRLLGIGANGDPIPIPKRRRKTRGRLPRASEPPPPPTTTSTGAGRGRDNGKGKERADRESSGAKRRKTLHEDVLQPTPSSAALGSSTSLSAPTFHKRAEFSLLEPDSDSSRSPSPFNVWRSSSPALPPSSSTFPTPPTSRSIAKHLPLPPLSSPCAPRRRARDSDVISISSDSEDEPIADPGPSLSGDDWLRNIAPFNGTPSVYSQRKARESQQSFRRVPASIHDSDAHPEDDDAMDLDLESVRGSQSQSVTPACHQPFSSSASINIAPRPYCSAPLRSSFIGNNALAANADGDASGDFLRDATVVRSLE